MTPQIPYRRTPPSADCQRPTLSAGRCAPSPTRGRTTYSYWLGMLAGMPRRYKRGFEAAGNVTGAQPSLSPSRAIFHGAHREQRATYAPGVSVDASDRQPVRSTYSFPARTAPTRRALLNSAVGDSNVPGREAGAGLLIDAWRLS